MAAINDQSRAEDIVAYDYAGSSLAAVAGCVPWQPAEIDAAGNAVAAAPNGSFKAPPEGSAQFERRLAEETRRSFEAGRARGMEEGRAAERAAQAAAMGEDGRCLAGHIGRLSQEFGAERDRYLHAVEHEVVKLALAIAARILRREAQMDPLLLLGAARVALGQLSATTQVRLRVPKADLELWSEAVSLLPGGSLKVQVIIGDGMRLGDCVLETELGSVDLGVRAQLSEIERGFFDRAASAEPAEPPA